MGKGGWRANVPLMGFPERNHISLPPSRRGGNVKSILKCLFENRTRNRKTLAGGLDAEQESGKGKGGGKGGKCPGFSENSDISLTFQNERKILER
ncbi:hypothetical protein CEXT_508791 [Caerostris extrusa]|uniref:Uncharacterized protein n=1 Tax=Caerostris extrusa TaxID=172846 RepID=A0AAV4M9P8_CAEEX|nr:hypothetical protein CEXT_508791 [Caerostris extrusa]